MIKDEAIYNLKEWEYLKKYLGVNEVSRKVNFPIEIIVVYAKSCVS